MQPMFPARRFFGSSPPQMPSLARTETNPMQLGPKSFIPAAFAASVNCCCNCFPASPPSAKPSAKMTPALTPFFPASSTTAATALLLTAITAKGISPSSLRDGCPMQDWSCVERLSASEQWNLIPTMSSYEHDHFFPLDQGKL